MRLKTGKAPTAEGEILVNEEFVRAMKWDNNGVGEYVPEHGTVTGILDGFRFIDAAQMEAGRDSLEQRTWQCNACEAERTV